jgi:ATP-dependent exoDNAse (exonuclease V) alpha subunit
VVRSSAASDVYKRQAKETPYTVRGMAASGEAAHQLERDSGIPSTTTARFLIDQTGREQAKDALVPVVLTGAIDLAGRDVRSLVVAVPAAKEAPGKELWVVDEASLAGQKDVSRVMEMADKASAKVVFVGDRLQLNAVDAGKPFELLQGAGIAGSQMSEISRQRVDDLKEAVALAIERRNAQAMAAIDGRVVELSTREALLSRAVSDILSKTKEERASSLLLVPLNKDRELVNNQVREGLVEAGQISKEKGAELGVLVAAGLTEAQRGSVGYYASGMVVRFGSGYRRLGVQSGDYAKVVGVDVKAGQIALEKEGGGRVIWVPHKQSKVEVYGSEKRALAAGDEIRFSRNSQELEVKNGTRAKVLEVTEQGFKAETATGVVSVSTAKAAHSHWEYAYSTTVHSSQGKTADATHLLITSDSGRAIGERAFYVGVTRGRDDMTIYTDSKAKARELISVRTEKSGALESLGGMPGAGDAAAAVIKSSGGSSGGRGVELER